MSRSTKHCVLMIAVLIALTVPGLATGADWTLIGWNDLGMHCMDADYSAMAILPPYNTIHAQLIDDSGNLVESPGDIVVTYEAVADPTGSINTTSVGKTGFWDWVAALFGAGLLEDEGLAGFDMPGSANLPQTMAWEASHRWFTGEGIPITPYDNSGAKNYYPLMRLVARNGAGAILATTDVVLPVSDEMDCRSCHGSGAPPAARPPIAGWVWNADPELDYRLNILRLHDEMALGDPLFDNALLTLGFDAAGLEATANGGQPILCAACHSSNALPGTGLANIQPLTQAVHALHSTVIDPDTGMALDDTANRTACYTCHPGSETRCLRGAMGSAVAATGELAMQCQSCHGPMSLVGAEARQGWFEEPTCQNCHTGTAMINNGQIRYTDAFESPGVFREAVNTTFATDPNTPLPGYSLYRFSDGHGGLQCSACHGSTHAIFPASHTNDNIQSTAIQGHAGTLVECSACHGAAPDTVNGGPHGMHPVGAVWLDGHKDALDGGGASLSQCRACHGADDAGTVLSESHADRTINTGDFGTKHFWRGYRIGCYTCHNGPNSEDPSPNQPPVVADAAAETQSGLEVAIPLTVTDPDSSGLDVRVISQPAGGLAWIVDETAYYRSDPSFTGADSFTFAAFDGKADSNLGAVTVSVTQSGGLFFDGFESGDTSGWQ